MLISSQFLQTIDEILFTNVDVTSAVLAFLLINLAATENTQANLREEIRQYSDGANGLDDYIAKAGTLLEHTCMESIRLCPATWFSLPEYSPHDKRIAGYLVPAGTPVIVDWKRLNTQSPVWNPQPNPGEAKPVTGMTFSPERFASLSPSQYRYSFLRYGLGPRKCIGKNFAAVIMKMMLVEVLGKYSLQFLDQDRDKVETRAFEIRDDRFTITPKQVVQFTRG
jgi:cytochrome P450